MGLTRGMEGQTSVRGGLGTTHGVYVWVILQLHHSRQELHSIESGSQLDIDMWDALTQQLSSVCIANSTRYMSRLY